PHARRAGTAAGEEKEAEAAEGAEEAEERNERLVRVDLVTLFPELFETFLTTSFVGRARTGGQLDVRLKSPRDFGLGKHKSVDDTPYGGGSGMVMRVDVLVQTMESLDA